MLNLKLKYGTTFLCIGMQQINNQVSHTIYHSPTNYKHSVERDNGISCEPI